MSQNESMGFVETIGLAAAIQAADIMMKSANVTVKTVANADAGLITVICRGDLASCNAAVDAAKAALPTPSFFNSNRIPRPSSDVGVLVRDHIGNMIISGKPAKKIKSSKK
ncbi:MAG: BMC domain-containing protein [Desulfotignum sp.]|jgi:microcompartment protein CcmL/EutN|nr:BMC domain-containing protein [Desulfotignum sp.]